ncbi:MAG: pyridoxal phosphate-dependent aminotransferase [bacterium]|nr:pyridoxal phosphate-dependent aminotransferase [bacterium]
MRLSRRAASMPASPIRKLVPLADEAKKRGTNVYHLNIGQPDIPTPKPFLEALNSFDKEVVAYGYSEGEHFLLDAFADYYRRFGIETERGEIAVTTAGSEAILFSLLITCDPGDEVIVFEPFYTNYNGFAKAAAVKLVPIECDIETGYHPPSREAIEKHITDKTRAIVICSPNNPTGAVFTRAEMEVFGDLACEYGLFIISDEVYREFVYDGVEHTSIMDIDGLDDRAIIADSISKRYSACGARIGCIVCKNKDVMTATLRFGQARLCPPLIEQYAVAAVLRQPPEEYVIPTIEEYRKRRDVVFDAITQIPGVVVKRPEGAFYMAPKLPVDDAERFVTWMLTDFSYDNSTVMLAPANGFYASPGKGVDEVRIAYVLNCERLKHAMEVLKEALNVYPWRK